MKRCGKVGKSEKMQKSMKKQRYEKVWESAEKYGKVEIYKVWKSL